MLIYLEMLETAADQSKFEQVYRRYRGLMFHVAMKILNNEQDAEDAVHEAFVAIAKNSSKIFDVECTKTRAYVVIIVERKAIDRYRAKGRKPTVPLEEETLEGEPPGLTFDTPGDTPLARAIAALPARYREFILLKYDYGYTNKELQSLFALSYAGVHSLDQRAKQRLRELLEAEGVTL